MTNKKFTTEKLSQDQIDVGNRPFYSMPLDELFEGFRLCRANARQIFSAANTVATDSPGLANSLMILCAEECVKCFVLFAVCSAIPVPFLIKPIFSNHGAKHVTGKELHGIVRIISNVLALFAPGGRGRSIVALAREMAGSNRDEEAWWDSANEMKNNGLYIDYRDGGFHTPASISAETFRESRQIVARFITLIDKTEFIKSDDFKLVRN